MVAAAGVVVGEHDFTSFAAVDPEREERMAASENGGATDFPTTNVRTIYSSSWAREGEEAGLYGSRQRISPSHGAQSGRHIFAGGEGNGESGGSTPHSRRARADGGWGDCARRRALSGWGGILRLLLWRGRCRPRRRRNAVSTRTGVSALHEQFTEALKLWRARLLPRTLLRRWPLTSNSPSPASPP